MTCKTITFDGANDAERCKCRGAVLRTYNAMLDEPEQVAFDAALRVYRYHHPEDSGETSQLTVERWVHADSRQLCN